MYTSTTFLAFAALTSMVSATPATSPILSRGASASIDPSLSIVDEIGWFDLGNFENNTADSGPNSARSLVLSESTALEKRTPIDYCVANAAQTANCIQLSGILAATTLAIAALIKSNSNAGSCSAHTGSIDSINYSVSATGQNCDTTAQQDTIQGALANYFSAQSNEVCNVKCLELTHGGTYTAWVTIAPAGTDPSKYFCGSGYNFGSCGSGGDNNVPANGT